MHRQLKQLRPSVRLPAPLEPDPHAPARWTSQTRDEVTALVARIDSLIGFPENG